MSDKTIYNRENAQPFFEEQAKGLGMAIDTERTFDHGVTLRYCDYVTIYVHMHGARGGKATASISADSKHAREANCWGDKYRHKIGFSPKKDLYQIIADIKRRLLNDAGMEVVANATKRVNEHLEYEARQENRRKLLIDAGFEQYTEGSDRFTRWKRGMDAPRFEANISGMSLEISYIEGRTDEEIAEMFKKIIKIVEGE